jgi:hypothetical protein
MSPKYKKSSPLKRLPASERNVLTAVGKIRRRDSIICLASNLRELFPCSTKCFLPSSLIWRADKGEIRHVPFGRFSLRSLRQFLCVLCGSKLLTAKDAKKSRRDRKEKTPLNSARIDRSFQSVFVNWSSPACLLPRHIVSYVMCGKPRIHREKLRTNLPVGSF